MNSGAFKVKFKPMNGGIQISPTPTVKPFPPHYLY